MPKPSFLRWTGAALMLGGLLTVLINAILTPAMATDVPFTQTAASTVFLWRQSASAAAAALLLFGSVGLYLAQDRTGSFGGISFALAFLGSALLLAWEWVDVFVLRELALRAPDALQTLEDEKQLTLYDLGALIPISIFAVGWIALSVWTLQGRALSRPAAAMVIAGFFLTPLLTAVFPGMWGGAVGSAVLGAGLMWLGYEVRNVRGEVVEAAAAF